MINQQSTAIVNQHIVFLSTKHCHDLGWVLVDWERHSLFQLRDGGSGSFHVQNHEGNVGDIPVRDKRIYVVNETGTFLYTRVSGLKTFSVVLPLRKPEENSVFKPITELESY